MALITLNGKPYKTECRSAFQLRNTQFNHNDVVIHNGFQITEDCPIQDGDILFIFKMVLFG